MSSIESEIVETVERIGDVTIIERRRAGELTREERLGPGDVARRVVFADGSLYRRGFTPHDVSYEGAAFEDIDRSDRLGLLAVYAILLEQS